MTSEAYRWQSAMGALSGALVAGAVAADDITWTADGLELIHRAEAVLAGDPVPVDLPVHHSIGVAITLAASGPPLLTDPTTVALFDAIHRGLDIGGRFEQVDPLLAKAAELARGGPFGEAITAAGGDAKLAILTGAFAGLEGGLGSVPARLTSTFDAADGGKGRRYLCGLTNRLLGAAKPNWYDPRYRRGPKEVLPGLWLSNVLSLSRFTDQYPDGLVLSLCNEEGRVGRYPNHLTFHIEDVPRTDANPCIDLVVDEVLHEVRIARAAAQPVLVHCRHGASRTGLILRLVLVEELGLSADDALTEAQCLWPHTSTWNPDWAALVERRSLAGPQS